MKDEKNIKISLSVLRIRDFFIDDEIEDAIYDYINIKPERVEASIKSLTPIVQKLGAFKRAEKGKNDLLYAEVKAWYVASVAWTLRAQRLLEPTFDVLDRVFKRFKDRPRDIAFIETMLMALPTLHKEGVIKIETVENVDQEPTTIVSFDKTKVVELI